MTGRFSRQDAQRLDDADELAPLRERFDLPENVIYLDGNSLGVLPRSTAPHLAEVTQAQWGRDLITSWNRHDWIGLPMRLGASIAPLIGADADEVIACDSTSINLFKLISAGVAARPDRAVVLIEEGGFPTDRYMADAAVAMDGARAVRACPREAIIGEIDADVAIVVLSHVDYRSGHRFDMASVTAAAHAGGR